MPALNVLTWLIPSSSRVSSERTLTLVLQLSQTFPRKKRMLPHRLKLEWWKKGLVDAKIAGFSQKCLLRSPATVTCEPPSSPLNAITALRTVHYPSLSHGCIKRKRVYKITKLNIALAPPIKPRRAKVISSRRRFHSLCSTSKASKKRTFSLQNPICRPICVEQKPPVFQILHVDRTKQVDVLYFLSSK